MKPEYLKTGNLYKITYKRQGGNYQWTVYEMTAVFLGVRQHDKELDFSLRPVLGTTTLHKEQILKVELVEKAVAHAYRGGLRDEKLPVKPSKRVSTLAQWEAKQAA